MAWKIAGLNALMPKTRNDHERRDNKHPRSIFAKNVCYFSELHGRMLLQASRRETKKIASGSASHPLRFLSVRLVVREFPCYARRDLTERYFPDAASLPPRIALTTVPLRNIVCPQLVGAAGTSPILKRLPTTQNPVSPAIREPASERRRTAFHRFARPAPASESQEDTIMRMQISALLVFLLVVTVVPAALPQSESMPVVYTYVSQFQVPRANWAAYSEDSEKSIVPILEKLLADGSIVSWSTSEAVIHTADGYTHSAVWSATSIAGLMKVLDEVRKNGPRPGQIAATKHEDLLLQTRMYHNGTGEPTYLRGVCSLAKPDKPENYTSMLKKLLFPTFEEQLKKGVDTYYGLDEQYVNTSAPSTRCLIIGYPNAESIDKWATAINTTMSKWSPAEREEFAAASVSDSRRDFLARITHSGHK